MLLHRFTHTARSWSALLPALAADFEAVALDAPGHGRAAAVRAGLADGARLLAEAGGEAAWLGYSMGGRYALHAALARPDLVRRLVLVGATAGIEDRAERARRRAADEERAAALERDGLEAFLDAWLAQPLFAGLAPSAADREARRANTAEGLASSLRLAGTGAQESVWDRLGELAMPVLLVTGERDEKFRALAERMADGIGANAAVAVVAGAGHACHLERPLAFLAAVRPFLLA